MQWHLTCFQVWARPTSNIFVSGSCFENPILIRRKNRTRYSLNAPSFRWNWGFRQPLELIDFCCKLCSEKGCSACGEEDPALADCPAEVSPYFIYKVSSKCSKLLVLGTQENMIFKVPNMKLIVRLVFGCRTCHQLFRWFDDFQIMTLGKTTPTE